MSDEKEVRLGYSSSHNISFNGTYETGIPRSEWDHMSDRDKQEVYQEALNDLVEVFELDDDEPDYAGRSWR
jgi:hypothetical protein